MNRIIKALFSAIFSLIFLTLNGFANVPQESISLKLNSPVSRSFQNSEHHFYKVSAKEKEIIEINCDQKGVDIELLAFSPDGEKLSVSNAPTGFAGKEILLFTAEKAGDYRIELKSSRPGTITGNYTIWLKDIRLPNENDIHRVEAMKFLGDAHEILQGWENRLEKADRAIEKLEKAQFLFEKVNDLQGQATTLFQIGYIIATEYGKNVKAGEVYEKALSIWAKIDDEAGKAICLTQAANELRDSGKAEKSLEYFNQAIAINRKLNNKMGEAVSLSFLCRLYNDTNRFQKGFETCRESLRLGQDSDPLTNYKTNSTLSDLYSNSGDNENGLKYMQISLERISPIKEYLNPIRFATIKGAMGFFFDVEKKYPEAIQTYQEALAVSISVNRPIFIAYYLSQLSLIFLETNKFEEALEYGEKALKIYGQGETSRSQDALNSVGQSYAALGQPQKARESFLKAITFLQENNDRYAEAATRYNLAKLEKNVGNLDTARENIQKSINLSEILRTNLLGKNSRSAYLGILKQYYELNIELLFKLNEKNPDSNFLEQAWQAQEKIRARSLLENFLENGFNLNEIATKEFLTKEQNLLESIANAERKRAEADKANNISAKKEADFNLQKSLDDYQVLQEEIRRNNPKFSAINQPKTFTFADVQSFLDENTDILEFSLGEKQSFAWLISKNSVKTVQLPSRNELNQTTREFYLALTDRNSANGDQILEKSRLLSRQTLQPFAKELSNIKRLVVIPDGSLQLIPFSALTLSNENYQPLVETKELVTLPSFSSFVYLRENKTTRQNSSDKLVAIFADPIFQSDDERFAQKTKSTPKITDNSADNSTALAQTLRDFGVEKLSRLPYSRIEAQEIAKFAPQKTTLALGTEASRQNFLRGDFSNYKILHFATHGFLNQQNPDLSGLVLSLYNDKRQAQNGFLRVIDLYSLRLNADLVVLSACQTGLGKEVDGEGIVGLTRGFMYAGASSVVSSLWKVEDAATAELMKNFYSAMIKDNQTPSAALRTAQNKLRKIPRFSKPQNWAGFTLTGDWK